MNNPVVSIIVPIYNVEKYLDQCLTSIKTQSLEDIEVLCINDGSTDSSLSIINHFVDTDKRFKLIDKTNSGYGHSVNVGLQSAAGDWIAIVEPDDFIDRRMLESLVENSLLEDGSTADVVKSSYWLHYDTGDTHPYIEQPFLSSCMSGYRCEFVAADNPEILAHHPSIWSAIYRRSFIEEKQIRMIEVPGAGWADNPWLYETLLQAEAIVWIPAAFYYYRQTNPEASTNLRDYHLPFDRLNDIRSLLQRLDVHDDRILTTLCARSLNYIVGTILGNPLFNEGDPELNLLIRHELEQLDSRLVLAPNNGISKRKKEFYRDIMGLRAESFEQHDKHEEPLLSILLPIGEDTQALWTTLESINAQNFENYEVICLSSKNPHRCLDIVNKIQSVDSRYTVITADTESFSTLYDIGADLCTAPYSIYAAPGVKYSDERYFELAAKACDSNADIICTTYDMRRYCLNRLVKDDEVNCEFGRKDIARVAANSSPLIYDKVINRAFLQKNNLRFPPDKNDEGFTFNMLLFSHASNATLARGVYADLNERDTLLGNACDCDSDQNFGIYNLDVLLSASNHESNMVDGGLLQLCKLHYLAEIVRNWGKHHGDEKRFSLLKTYFEQERDIELQYKRGQCPNSQDYWAVYCAFSQTYEQYMTSIIEDSTNQLRAITRNRDANRIKARKRLTEIKALKKENSALRDRLAAINEKPSVAKRISKRIRGK